ncbi:IS3 family transposase [Streptomyces sp. NPDC057950]|uniref:IS3 family transposase n=1 Tax=Streptomyces sp. NPDC057950 TaxID=3346288 RepID=UPI0036EF592B
MTKCPANRRENPRRPSEPKRQVFEANYLVYGAREIRHQLHCQGHRVARCRVERLMRELGTTGALRGRYGWWALLAPRARRSAHQAEVPMRMEMGSAHPTLNDGDCRLRRIPISVSCARRGCAERAISGDGRTSATTTRRRVPLSRSHPCPATTDRLRTRFAAAGDASARDPEPAHDITDGCRGRRRLGGVTSRSG